MSDAIGPGGYIPIPSHRVHRAPKLPTAADILKEIEEYAKLEPCSDHHCPCGGAGHYVAKW